jgi:hypothetical protein
LWAHEEKIGGKVSKGSKEDRMTFTGERRTDRDNRIKTDYDNDIDAAERARNTQRHDSDPMIEKEGFLGVDDLDRLRRRKISKLF